jgi:hypothetical protein
LAYTVPSTVASGNVITAAGNNSYRTAIIELQAALPEASTSWASPIAAGITIGSGTVTGSYARIGDIVHCRFRFTFGAGSAITGAVSLQLPVTAVFSAGAINAIGEAVDASATTFYQVWVAQLTSTTVAIRAVNAAATYTTGTALASTVPFTWAASDELNVTFSYFAA